MKKEKLVRNAAILLGDLDKLQEVNHKRGELKREIWEMLKTLRSGLGEKEYFVLKMRIHEVRTLEEVAQKLGVTRERVRQIEAKTMEKIRALGKYD